MKHASFLLATLTIAASLTHAQDAEPTSIQPPPISSEEPSRISVELSAGYDSHYIFRGELLQENTPWIQLSVDVPISDSVTFNVTPWYLHDADSDYNEFDLQTGLSISAGICEIGVGYAHYNYPRGGLGNGQGVSTENEFVLMVSRDLGPLSASVQTAYNIEREGFYYEAGLDLPIEFGEKWTITPGLAIGADTNYFARGTGFNHVGLKLAATYKLTESIEIEPYLAGNFPFSHLEGEDQIYGGISVRISF